MMSMNSYRGNAQGLARKYTFLGMRSQGIQSEQYCKNRFNATRRAFHFYNPADAISFRAAPSFNGRSAVGLKKFRIPDRLRLPIRF